MPSRNPFDVFDSPDPKSSQEQVAEQEESSLALGQDIDQTQKSVSRSEELARLEASVVRKRNRKFIDENEIKGVPLDIYTGVGHRAGASFRSIDPEQEFRYWQKIFGEDGVRILTDGSYAIRTYRDGKRVDVVVDERKMTWKDFADLANVAPEIALEVAAYFATKRWYPKGFGKRIVESGVSAITSQIAGAQSDLIVDWIDEEKVDLDALQKIIVQRGKMAGVQWLMGLAGAKVVDAAGTAARFVLDPFGGARGKAQQEYIEIIKFIEKKTGVKIKSTAAQETGDPKLARLESLVANVPGGQEAFLEFKRLQNEAIESVQKKLIGLREDGDYIPSEEDLANDVIETLRSKIDQAVGAANFSRREVVKRATQEISEEFDRLSTSQRIENAGTHSDATRAAIIDVADTKKVINRDKYEELYARPEANQVIFGLAGLADKAKEIRRNLPTKNVVETIDYKILDEFGKPVLTQKIKNTPIKAFIPTEFKNLLDEVATLGEEGKTLSEMVQMRTHINDLINQSEPVENYTNKRLKEFSSEITNEIDRVTTKMPDGEFKALLTNANENYKKTILPLRNTGVRELLIDPNSPGGADPIKFVSSLYKDADKYKNVKSHLGENSQAFKNIKKNILDTFLSDAGVIGVHGDLVDAVRLQNALRAARQMDGGFVIDDILGKGMTKTLNAAIEMAIAVGKDTGYVLTDRPNYLRVPLDRILQDAELHGQPSVRKLMRMMDQQKIADDLYRNSIIDSMVGRKEVPVNFNPSKFVNEFMMSSGRRDFDQVMSLLNGQPVLLDNIRRKAVQDFFIRADNAHNANDLLSNFRLGKRDMGPNQMARAFGSPTQQSNFEALVGQDTIDILHAMMKVKAVQQNTDEIGGMTGGLIGGSIMNDMFSNTGKGLYKMTKYRIASIMLTNKWASKLLKGSHVWAKGVKNASDIFGGAVLMSEPGVRAMVEEFGEGSELDNAYNVARNWLHFDTSSLRDEMNSTKVNPFNLIEE